MLALRTRFSALIVVARHFDAVDLSDDVVLMSFLNVADFTMFSASIDAIDKNAKMTTEQICSKIIFDIFENNSHLKSTHFNALFDSETKHFVQLFIFNRSRCRRIHSSEAQTRLKCLEEKDQKQFFWTGFRGAKVRLKKREQSPPFVVSKVQVWPDWAILESSRHQIHLQK